jgi:hypothetical protein
MALDLKKSHAQNQSFKITSPNTMFGITTFYAETETLSIRITKFIPTGVLKIPMGASEGG